MAKKRTFISFDYDNDVDLKNLLVGQARLTDSPFEITDMSIKETINNDWETKARTRIKGCNVVVVICGEKMSTATGVSTEIKIAKEEGIPHFLLRGRSTKTCIKPAAATKSEHIYNWTWPNLKALINGGR